MGITGDSFGVALWNLMAQSNDDGEKLYFSTLSEAATQYGKVWFTDIVTRRETKENQTTFQMEWDVGNDQWVVDVFVVPIGADTSTERISKYTNDHVDNGDSSEGTRIKTDPIMVIDD